MQYSFMTAVPFGGRKAHQYTSFGRCILTGASMMMRGSSTASPLPPPPPLLTTPLRMLPGHTSQLKANSSSRAKPRIASYHARRSLRVS